MKRIFLFLLVLVSPIVSWGQTAYICIPSASNGFTVRQGGSKWEITKFRIDDVKKILKKNNGEWKWSRFGESTVFSDCSDGISEEKKNDFNFAGYLFCDTLSGHVRINKKTLRYLETYEYGFVEGKDNNENTPFIEIGTCSPL